jgi:hypothetical protein
MSNETATAVHKFEQAGLGKAPFRFVGKIYQDIRYGNAVVVIDGVECETKPGGSCDYCGQYIVNMFQIESADGRRFKVGCDCLGKTGDAGLVRKAKKIISDEAAARRRGRDAAKLTEERTWFETVRTQAQAIVHPDPRFAAHGETLADMVDWFGRYAGTSGKLGAYKTARRLLGAAQDAAIAQDLASGKFNL